MAQESVNSPRIGNAAGTCKTRRHFSLLLRSAADVVTIGPITLHERPYNPGNNEYVDAFGRSINSHGLPSEGLDVWREQLPQWRYEAEKAGKILAVSVPPLDKDAESGKEDVEVVVEMCVAAGIRIIEVNCGCSNVWKGSEQKRILSFQPRAIEDLADKVLWITEGSEVEEVRFKLSPYSDPGLLAEVASVLAPRKAAVVTSNTFANAYMFREEDGRPAVEFGKHLGGYGGRGMKPIALGQVAQFHELLPNHRIIGVGGIDNGRDLYEFWQVGAVEGQLGSSWYFTENPRSFGDVLSQFLDIVLEE